MRRCFRICIALILAIGLTACASEPIRQPVSVPALPEPAAQEAAPAASQPAPPAPPPAPAAPTVPPSVPAETTVPATKPIAEVDLDGDGQAEQLFISDDRQLQVIDSAGRTRFSLKPPALVASAKTETFLMPGRPPLVRVYWSACPYSYPDNVFITYVPEQQAIITDRDPKIMLSCGTYEHLGDGSFEVVYRHNDVQYRLMRTWDRDHFTLDSTTALMRQVRVDQLPGALDTLAGSDVTNPEALFATPDLYRQFRSTIQKNWHLHDATEQTPSSSSIRVEAGGKTQGELLVTYDKDAKNAPFILITGLEFSPAPDANP